ncbi:myb-like protein AA [Drosophila hydei]|uniref:Myb-like protein AA n=1 Tax=Drosophila hydei TaxID=7224 RepID=A0A6J1LGC2_DROHY|nr:myb-like protein AA [Drosophila hydei]
MSARRYYFGAEKRYNTSVEGENDGHLYPCDNKDNNNNNNTNNSNNDNDDTHNEPDADKDDDSEYLQDVPYSSSSIDRSSIGSIPWADDAIKKNKQDWERVDRMLSGEEPLPELEPELRHEIADWQRKFPSLLARKAQPLKQQSLDSSRRNTLPDESGDIDSISDLSLNSLDDYDERDGDDDDDDGFLTPTAARLRDRQQAQPMASTRNYLPPAQKLVAMLDRDLHITSVALKLRKREHSQQPPAPITPQSATVARSRLRMPPILNVLDSNRRFRGLLNNRSFVQLTQVQHQQQHQPKSAALTYASSAERRQLAGVRSAWNMPMAASRFLNNKHAIVLPSLNRHRDFSTTATSSQSISSGGATHNRNSMDNSSKGRNYNIQHSRQYGLSLDQVTTNSNTPSTGRSISAAIHHPRSEFNTSSAFYIPYSASKFKAFK